jgi:putative flavoprotein involved in K+ transport
MKPATSRRRPLAGTVDVVVVGAGHSGLAMSRALSSRALDHVVLERGEVANSWRHERWDSLRLLTPNWQARLPGRAYDGDDPDGFMTMPEVIGFIDRYAHAIGAPVRTSTRVTSVRHDGEAFRVETDRGTWRCRAVVLANGGHGVPNLPAFAYDVPVAVRSLAAQDYRNPSQIDARGVLVVGASATGLQIADELARAGRRVTLAVGEHIRLPRRYRGIDIQRWLDALGILDQRYDEVDDIVRARRVPSPQLVGATDHATLDLNALTARGVMLAGRLVGIHGGRAQFSGSLAAHCAMADLKLNRLLDSIDAQAGTLKLPAGAMPRPADGERPPRTVVPPSPPLSLELAAGAIGTILWATGYRPNYDWLHVPAFDAKGRLRHDGGVVPVPGIYVLGLNFLRRRKSSFMHGAEDDVRELSAHLADYLRSARRRPAAQVAVA